MQIRFLINFFIFINFVFVNNIFADKSNYQIGSKGPAGGIVFSINPNLEVFFDDYTVLSWQNTSQEKIINNTIYDFGTINSEEILKWVDIDPSNRTAPSAQYCKDLEITYNNNVYKDLFLPSKEELLIIYDNKDKLDFFFKKMEKKGLDAAKMDFWFWSSTEHDKSSAFVFHLSTGESGTEIKTFESYVYCIRSF